MDETVCIIDYLKKVSEFFIHESCGKCVPCREGNRQMYMILHRFATGLATERDFERMERLSFTMATASSCGLGSVGLHRAGLLPQTQKGRIPVAHQGHLSGLFK